MKKRTLNQTWVLCLRMWRWIAKVWQTPRYRRYDVYELKKIWLEKSGFRNSSMRGSCFFCDYKKDNGCCSEACPGAVVFSGFNCCNYNYHYGDRPVAFYAELLRLNRIRKGKR